MLRKCIKITHKLHYHNIISRHFSNNFKYHNIEALSSLLKPIEPKNAPQSSPVMDMDDMDESSAIDDTQDDIDDNEYQENEENEERENTFNATMDDEEGNIDDNYEEEVIEEEKEEISFAEQLIINHREAKGLQYHERNAEDYDWKPNPRLPGPSQYVNPIWKRKPKYPAIGTVELPLSSKYPIGGTIQTWIYNSNSKKLGLYNLSNDIFDQEVRIDILYRNVKFELNRKTGWTWDILPNRSEIRGSTRKQRPQTGTGKSRVSDRKAAHLETGGFAHGKRPKDFTTKLPWRARIFGYKVALSARFKEGDLYIWDEFLLPKYDPNMNDTYKDNKNMENKHKELDNLIPVNELDSNINNVLYSDIIRVKQMLKKWGWLKGSLYEFVNDIHDGRDIINAKKTGNLIDILDAMPISKYEWNFLKEEDELKYQTKCSILMIYHEYVNQEFKETINKVDGIELLSWNDIKDGLGVFKLMKYKKIIINAQLLQYLNELLSHESNIKRWNFHANMNRIRQSETLRDAF